MRTSTFRLGGALLLLAALLIGQPALAVVEQISPSPKLQFFDNTGHFLTGGKLFTYAAGSTTKTNTYIDSSGGTPNANPVILDTRGEARVWLIPGQSYKFVLSPSTDTDPPTNAIWTVDNIVGSNFNGTVTSVAVGCGLTAAPSPIIAAGTISISTIADNTVLGNTSGSTACPSAIPIAELFTLHGQQFTTTGTFTLASASLKVTIIGAGGGGGGGGAGGEYGGSSGGGGGACIAYLSGLTIGNTVAITINAAGTGGATTVAGSAGGNAVLSSGTQTISTRTGTGGGGGMPGAVGAGAVGTGGTPTCQSGDLVLGGNDGTAGFSDGAGAPQIPPGVFAQCGAGGFGGSATASGGNASGGCAVVEWVAPP